MAITVGDRIDNVIKDMDLKKYDHALSEVCIAIDLSAKKHYGLQRSSRRAYQKFLQENMWIILVTAFGGVIASGIKIPFQHADLESDEQGYCTLEQIVYFVMRCGFVHGTGEDSKIVWNPRVQLEIDSSGQLQLTPSFIWGLVVAVVACKENINERVGDTAWIQTMTFKYLVNDLWGKESSLYNMVKSQIGIVYQPKPEIVNQS